MRTFGRIIAVSLISVLGVAVLPAQGANAQNVPCCHK